MLIAVIMLPDGVLTEEAIDDGGKILAVYDTDKVDKCEHCNGALHKSPNWDGTQWVTPMLPSTK